MSVENFLDANVFVYQLEGLETRKAAIAGELIQQGIANGSACISFQVVQECLHTGIHKARIRLTENEMRKYLQSVLAPLLRVQPSIRLFQAALDIQLRYRFSFYDSLIVAAALEAGCKTIYSEDLQHAQVIEGLTIENPFRA